MVRYEYRAEAWDDDSNDHDETLWFGTEDEARAEAYKLAADPPFHHIGIFRRRVCKPALIEEITL